MSLLIVYYTQLQTDFGDSKQLTEEDDKEEQEPELDDFDDRNSLFEDPTSQRGQARKSFVGTALYISPEMLNDNIAVPASDLWALGCIIYQMRAGVTPFHANVDYEVFQKITSATFSYPLEFEAELADIVN